MLLSFNMLSVFVITGSPSGHAMGAAGVYYTLVTSILTILTSKKSSNTNWWVKKKPFQSQPALLV